MMYSSIAFRFVLAAALSAATSATMLRGTSPITNTADTPVESLVDAQSRGLGLLQSYEEADVTKGLAVHGGVGVTFTRPSSTVKSGNVCGQTFFTGDSTPGDYDLLNGEAYQGGCPASDLIELRANAMNITAMPLLTGALGGQSFTAGTYYAVSALAVDSNTNVTLIGGPNDIFLFQSGSYMITGANTHFILEKAEGAAGPPHAKNILFALAGYSTTGFETTLEGSILAGAAITHGAGSAVSGYVLATAAMTVGVGCYVN